LVRARRAAQPQGLAVEGELLDLELRVRRHRERHGFQEVDGARRRRGETAVLLALLLERRDLGRELRLLVDDGVHVRERRGEERADLRPYGLVARRETAPLENEARQHEDERDGSEHGGTREAAPHRLPLAMVRELRATEVDLQGVGAVAQREAE